MPVDQRALVPLANARNGVAHAGIHHIAEVQTVFTTCLRLVDPLLTELKIDQKQYWGGYEQLHDRLIEKRVQCARIELEAKLAKARADFEQRYGHLDEASRQTVLATITRYEPMRYMEHDEEQECPACASRAWLMGETYIDDDKNTVVFSPFMLMCSACDLHLTAEDLPLIGNLANEIDLEERPENFYFSAEQVGTIVAQDWEPGT
ncbi:hypothetical protein ACIRPK_36715 [Kitasatospora sp. NPDC101801]|uniref:hypothetical protein n=1 Tax=Kitasatospora sp. NPDC101801 TaxID=3364103 RepID=UPI003801BB5C